MNAKAIDTTEDQSNLFPLWPIFILELLSLVIWSPIAALMGMGYTSSFSWGNVCLLIFHLYPIYIIFAIPIAMSLRHYRKIGNAVFIAALPPILSGIGFLALMTVALHT